MFIIILFGIKQLKNFWKKTFKKYSQLSCFLGHPVYKLYMLYKRRINVKKSGGKVFLW